MYIHHLRWMLQKALEGSLVLPIRRTRAPWDGITSRRWRSTPAPKVGTRNSVQKCQFSSRPIRKCSPSKSLTSALSVYPPLSPIKILSRNIFCCFVYSSSFVKKHPLFCLYLPLCPLHQTTRLASGANLAFRRTAKTRLPRGGITLRKSRSTSPRLTTRKVSEENMGSGSKTRARSGGNITKFWRNMSRRKVGFAHQL